MEELNESNLDYKRRTCNFDPSPYEAAYYVKGNCSEKPTNEQYFNLSKCFDLIPKDMNYDYCVRVRLDTRLNEIFNLNTIKLVSIEKSDEPFTKKDFYDLEHFFCGKYNDMKYICKEFSKKIGSYTKKQYIGNIDFTQCPETQFSQFLYENNYKLKNSYNHRIHYIKSDIYDNMINQVFCYHIYLTNNYKIHTEQNNNIKDIVLKNNVINFKIVSNKILEAWYGTKEKHISVEDILLDLMNNCKTIMISNTTFKIDPHKYYLKQLCVVFENKSLKIQKIYFNENTEIKTDDIKTLIYSH